MTRTKTTFFSPSEVFGHYQHHLRKNLRICGRLQSINAHADQETSELGGTRDYTCFQKLYHGYHSQWRSVNTWRSNGIRLRP